MTWKASPAAQTLGDLIKELSGMGATLPEIHREIDRLYASRIEGAAFDAQVLDVVEQLLLANPQGISMTQLCKAIEQGPKGGDPKLTVKAALNKLMEAGKAVADLRTWAKGTYTAYVWIGSRPDIV
jgi:hypothetical protein